MEAMISIVSSLRILLVAGLYFLGLIVTAVLALIGIRIIIGIFANRKFFKDFKE